MIAEHFCQWLISATRDGIPDSANWQKVFAILQVEFCDGALAKECTLQTVVLIPKGKSGNFMGIVLVEVIWKTISSLLNLRLTSAIMFHDMIHGFRAGRGTGTATLEAKLLQQLMAMREAVIFKVFLDLQKAYDDLDRYRCLGILEAYGVGPRTIRLLRTYWGHLIMVDRSGGYFGMSFKGY